MRFLIIFVITSWAQANTPIYQKLLNAQQDSIYAVGTVEDMRLRSMLFHSLYKEDNSFLFALSTAHLTLAIDRFANSGYYLKKYSRVLRNRKFTNDLILWGEILKKINQKMTQLLIFSKKVWKIQKQSQLTTYQLVNAVSHNQSLSSDIKEIIVLLDLWKKLDKGINYESIAKEFIHWEHHLIIQPRLIKSLPKVGKLLRYSLRHVAGRWVERKILKRYNIRSTINLNCFERAKYIHTKNFLDPYEREKRAIEFLNELKKINYDPTNICFNDPYYDY